MATDSGTNQPSDSPTPTPLVRLEPDRQKSADLGNSREGGDAPKEKQAASTLTWLQKANLALATVTFVVNGGFGLPPVHTPTTDRRSTNGDQHQVLASPAPAPRGQSSPADDRSAGTRSWASAPEATATIGGVESGASPDLTDEEGEPGEGQERQAEYWEQKKKEEEAEEAGESASDVDADGQEAMDGAELRSAGSWPATSSTQASADLLSSRFPSADPAGRT